MPRNPINYSKTIIYKLCCNDINITEIYIGSTTDFKARKKHHKSNCNNEKCKIYNLKVYQYIRDNGGWDNWSMIMIEEYSCNSKLEAEKRERYYIEELKSTLNYNIPTQTKKEYYENNQDKLKEYKKEYYKNNQDKLKEYHKEYYENNQDKLKEYYKEYCENNQDKIKEYKKEYCENNQDKLKEYKKEWYENNKKKLKEKFNCDCGGCYTKNYIYRHIQTKKHQEYLKVSIPQNNTCEIVA
jgi:hypothetical protein